MKVIKQKIPFLSFLGTIVIPWLDNCLHFFILFDFASVYIFYWILFYSQALLLLPLLLTTGCSAQSGDLLKELLNDGSLSVVGISFLSSNQCKSIINVFIDFPQPLIVPLPRNLCGSGGQPSTCTCADGTTFTPGFVLSVFIKGHLWDGNQRWNY